MFKTNIEFKKGILFIKVNGDLDKKNSIELKRNVVPIILKNGFKYVVLNLSDVNLIEDYGIDVLNDISDVVSKFNGKTTLIKNKKVDNMLKGTLIDKAFYRVKDERLALGVFEL